MRILRNRTRGKACNELRKRLFARVAQLSYVIVWTYLRLLGNGRQLAMPMANKLTNSLRFISAFMRDRKNIGAVLPSSPGLARAMVKALGSVEPGKLIIELGPGTGVFTKEIVKRYPDNPLMIVEFSDTFIAQLRNRFPRVTVVNGCASELIKHIQDNNLTAHDVGGLISGLPLLSLPAQLRDAVWSSIAEVLPADKRYVQFTYSKRAWRKFHVPHMKLEHTRRVFFNVPPAVVLPFRRQAS